MRSLQDTSIQYIKGVGPARMKMFMRLGIENVEDLLYFFPKRYEDRRHLTPIAQVKLEEWQTISGKIISVSARKSWYTKKHVSEIVLDDGSGRMICTWFSQPYLQNYLKKEKNVVCYGKVDNYKERLQMVSPEYEIIEEEGKENLSINRIAPVYALTRGVTQRYLRKIIKLCIDKYRDQLQDTLPVPLRNKYTLPNIKRSISHIHFPKDFEDQENALKRISFEEFYFFQISIILRRLSITQKQGILHQITDSNALSFMSLFAFELTAAQKKVIRQIRQDMQNDSPMLRLLQGDVGSGKTIVAIFGCFMAFKNDYQSCIMAPTEILARQHFGTINEIIKNGPFADMKIALLVSHMKVNEKEALRDQIKNGEIDLVVGTHALISDDIKFKKLSFVVIDEQHKFGVRQRALLSQKGQNPDVLIMTATPIPRTLCITLFGDLDVSIIDEIPPGRGKVKTRLYRQEQAKEVYALVKDKVKQGSQAYIVYPIIEESVKSDLKAAQDMYKHFTNHEFKGCSIGLVHGQMKQKNSREIMEKFKNKEIDILVATIILEVGVDVPNAGVMVIEHAERFGLAQLHQLRGRIGRGNKDGHCFLISDPITEEGKERLKAIVSTNDGFKIAQYDLEIRGPGHFFGRHQHGMNELKVANPATQLNILELARKEAVALTSDDPKLKKTANQNIKNIIRRRYPTYLAMVTAG